MKYDVIVSDYDGTLLRSDRTLSENTVNAIKEFTDKGGKFFISTGRPPEAILPQARKLGLLGSIICCQGAVMCDIITGKLQYSLGIPAQNAIPVLQRICAENDTVLLFYEGVYYAEKPSEILERYAEITHTVPHYSGKPLAEFLMEKGGFANKISTLQFPEETERVFRKYKDVFPGIRVGISDSFIVEYADVGLDKGTALKELRKLLPDPGAKIITIGDSLIDRELLLAGDLGVAVGNAAQEIKDVADVVTVTNDEDAVAYVIQRYCLS